MAKTIQEYEQNISAAKVAMDSAYTSAQNHLAALNACNCGRGKDGGRCTPTDKNFSFGDIASVSDCRVVNFINKTQTSCATKETCIGRVNSYNASYSAYTSAKQIYESAVNEYETFVKNNPGIKNELAETENRNKFLLYGGITLLVIIGTIIAIRYYKKQS